VVWEKKIATTYAIFSPDGSKIYANGNGKFYILDTESGKILDTLEGIGKIIGFSPDGKYFYTDSGQKVNAMTYEIIDTLKTKSIKEKYPNLRLSHPVLNYNGAMILYSGKKVVPEMPDSYPIILAVSTESMDAVQLIEMDTKGSSMQISVSPDGRFLIVSISNYVWTTKYEDRGLDLELWDAKTLKKIQIIEQWDSDEIERLSNLTFSPNSQMLACTVDGKIQIYDMKTMKRMEGIKPIDIKLEEKVQFSSNSEYLIWTNTDYMIQIANINPFENKYSYKNLKISQIVRDVSPDSKYLLIEGGSIENWHLSLIPAYWDGNSIANNNKLGLIIEVNPNPLATNATIEYELPYSGKLSIEIINQEGINNILYAGIGSEGKNTLEFNTGKYSAGQYFIRLVFEDNFVTEKIIISK
jgi:WD40 repeat protein